MTDSTAPDWEAFVRRQAASGVAEIDLTAVLPGDRLLVVTEHTAYTFTFGPDRAVELITNRADRPSGRVQLNGCTFGASSSIKPDRVFCGGNIEFIHGEAGKTYTTTAIRALQLLQSAEPAP